MCAGSASSVGDVGVAMMMLAMGAVSVIGMVLACDHVNDGSSLLLDDPDGRGLVSRDVVVMGRGSGGGVVGHVG